LLKLLGSLERDGIVRTFHIDKADQETLQPIAKAQIEGTAHIVTDGLFDCFD